MKSCNHVHANQHVSGFLDRFFEVDLNQLDISVYLVDVNLADKTGLKCSSWSLIVVKCL